MISVTNWPAVGASVSTNGDPIVIWTPDLRVEINRSPCRLSVFDSTGTNLLIRERAAEGVFADGARFDHQAGADFYGIGSYNAWDDSSAGMLRSGGGWVEAGYQGDAGAPLAWTRHGFGVLVDSDGVQFNITSTNLTFEYVSRTNIEYYIAVGPPDAILSAAAEISGKAPLFPKYAMGFANTEWDINQAELTNIVNTYRAKGIPLDQYIVDFDWKAWSEDNYGEWRWNTSKFPGGPSGALQTQMQAAGIHLSGIMKPRIFVYTTQGNYASANGFWWPGSSMYQDYFTGGWVNDLNFALADCRAWFWDHITNAFHTGITGWWNDEADQRGGGGGFFDNWQFLNMQKALYEGQRAYSTQRVWSINRNFYLGAQRYAYAMWSGDIDTGFSSMAAQRERMLTAINLGQALWGMDIGGFNGGDPSPENYARWMQFGAVVPVYRVHGQQYAQRQPWVYGSTAEAAAAAAIRLRYQLLPYVYSYARRLTETGVGLVRPLFHVFPGDPALGNYRDAWMFGDYLLAAPVVAQGQSAKSIYLPEGVWRDYFKGTRHTGRQTISYPLNTSTWEDLPLFIREGAILPTQPVMNHTSERSVTNLTVDVFPATSQTVFAYYEDDGISYAYETGEFFKQVFSAQDEGESIRLGISEPEGTFVPPLQDYFIRLYCPTASSLTINGTAATRYATLPELEAAAGEGWTETTNRFGHLVAVKVVAGAERAVVISNNAVATPVFLPPGGIFTGAVVVSLSCATPDAEIRCTVDGSDPDESSAPYTEPLLLVSSAHLKARAFKAGRTPSMTAEAVFTREDNLLRNAGFEQQGSSTNNALYWVANEPDLHGETWGSALRVSWRSRSDDWQGTVRGTWAGAGSEGGFWQEAPAAPGRNYRFSAWLWADSDWSPAAQGLKLEFFSGTNKGDVMLAAHTNLFTGIGPNWTNRAMQATAPETATWVRVVVFASGVSGSGALQFDDLRLEPTNVCALTILSAHGDPVPAAGVHLLDRGQILTNSVNSPVLDGARQYVCPGWTLTGHSPTSGIGHSMSMTVTNDAVLRWLWTTNDLNPSELNLFPASGSIYETSSWATLTVQRQGGTDGEVSVSYHTVDGTATGGQDYVSATGVVVLADGVVSQTFNIAILDDLQHEPEQTFSVMLQDPVGATLTEPTQSVVTIEDDDPDLGQRTLTVTSAHGLPYPPAGLNTYDYGFRLYGSVTGWVTQGTTQWACEGWSGSGSAPAAGATNHTPDFLLTNDSSLTWHWTTNVYFERGSGPNGAVAGSAGGWYALGDWVSITAAPIASYHFAGWQGDVPGGQALDNPLLLALDQARSVTATFAPDAGANLLNNPSFEQQGLTEERPYYWAAGDPDAHGEMWGTAARVNWRSNSGSWEGAIRGAYSGAGTEGGFWQEVPVQAGQSYRFSGWFWADAGNPYGPWGAVEQVIKIEYFSGETGGVSLLSASTATLAGVVQTWEERHVSATAPPGTTWGRVVVLARDISYDGSLQFDDMDLERLPFLAAPVIQGVGSMTATSCVLTWGAVAQATGYLVDVATNGAFASPARATDLFISEYGEGTGNERYIEIWNGTEAAVDLTAYRVWGISAGGSWFESSLALSNTLAPGSVHVVANSGSTSAVLRAAAHQLAANAAPMNFSGDDALGLAKVIGAVTSLIDAVGTSGADPGTGWGAAGVADATYNHTLIRQSAVTAGNTDWLTCSNEWIVEPLNTWSNAGAHTMTITPGDFVNGYEARSAGTPSLLITGLTAGATYHFRVRATNSLVTSASSDPYETSWDAAYILLAVAGSHGSISPSGPVSVGMGESTSFLVQADAYYAIDSITTNGGPHSLPSGLMMYTMTWNQVSSTGMVEAVFTPILADHRATPWWWLAGHSLTNSETDFNAAELQDLDEDGQEAWEEYVADTDPNASASILRVEAPAPGDPGGYIIRWVASSNRYYHLYGGTQLTNSLTRLTNNLPGTPPLNSYTDSVFEGQSPVYYRVRALLTPEEGEPP